MGIYSHGTLSDCCFHCTGCNMSNDDLVYRLRKRAEIRRQIPTRKSVQEGQPDRIADLLEEAANRIEQQEIDYNKLLESEK